MKYAVHSFPKWYVMFVVFYSENNTVFNLLKEKPVVFMVSVFWCYACNMYSNSLVVFCISKGNFPLPGFILFKDS